MSLSIPYISHTSIWTSWKAVRKELKNSSIRDVVDFLDYDIDPDVWINRLVSSIRRGTYDPDLARRFTLGKSKGFSRTITFPAIADLTLYRSLVDSIFRRAQGRQHKHVSFLRSQSAARLLQSAVGDKANKPAFRDRSLSAYPSASERNFLNWLKYDQYRKYMIFSRIHRYFVITDVANFFDSVLHSHVAEALQGLPIPARTAGLLFFLLERLSIRQEYAGSHGISLPVDEFDCSRTLAHMVLFPHDDDIVKLVGEENYARWMDDQIMGVASRAEGLRVLSVVGRSLARLHLSPNVQKSKVLSLAEARRHFHLDLNQLLDQADDLMRLVIEGKAAKRTLLKQLGKFWSTAKKYEGQGEFEKILKRTYRLAGFAGARKLRRRAANDILANPSLAERVCDYVRCTGTVQEYIAFASSLLGNPEQVYPDVNVTVVESLLRLEPSATDGRQIRQLAVSLLSSKLHIVGKEQCAVIAPLLILRFGDRRSLPLLKRLVEDPDRTAPTGLLRSCAIVYASFGVDCFRIVRKVASKTLRNQLSQTVRFLVLLCYKT